MRSVFVLRDISGSYDTRYGALTGSIYAREKSQVVLYTNGMPYYFVIEAGRVLELRNVQVERLYVDGHVLLAAIDHEPLQDVPPQARMGGELVSVTSAPSIEERLDNIYTRLDVDLSTRASESTLQDVLGQLDVKLSEAPILTPYPLTPQTVKFEGTWTKSVYDASPSGYYYYSKAAGAKVHVWFYGKRFAVAFKYGPDRGIVNIYVDGALIDQVDCYDTTYYWRQHYYEADQDGLHELVIEVSGEKNPSSTDYYVVIGGIYFEGRKNINSPYIYYLKYIYDMYVTRLSPYAITETTTPLPAGAEFIGSWHDSNYPAASYVVVLAYADTDMDVYVEQSHNASTIIRSDKMSYTANSVTGNMLKVQLMGRYWRVRAVNTSSSDQTKLVIARRYAFA